MALILIRPTVFVNTWRSATRVSNDHQLFVKLPF